MLFTIPAQTFDFVKNTELTNSQMKRQSSWWTSCLCLGIFVFRKVIILLCLTFASLENAFCYWKYFNFSLACNLVSFTFFPKNIFFFTNREVSTRQQREKLEKRKHKNQNRNATLPNETQRHLHTNYDVISNNLFTTEIRFFFY